MSEPTTGTVAEHLSATIWKLATLAAREQFGDRIDTLEAKVAALSDENAHQERLISELRDDVHATAVPEPQSLRA